MEFAPNDEYEDIRGNNMVRNGLLLLPEVKTPLIGNHLNSMECANCIAKKGRDRKRKELGSMFFNPL